ncbi:putative phage protein gp47/JayE [Paenibacillus sp. PastF-3]|uniref:baseplate J/gp47 family protein n=1 Tax=Paenibacillus sp. PastF-3 TaxID=2940626 RepID=UPI0024750245|nr:baseplate J/gp47 family protein [Paenibacillus sp. PastF-3]MDH6370543.1 putative phage protein gp47/JayE [Paenibacillus sp. PastF-3]
MDEQGFKRMRFADWFANMEDKAKKEFGDITDTSELSTLGIILRLGAWYLGKADERLEDVYNSSSLNASTGVNLYKLGGNDGLSVYSEEFANGNITVSGTPGYTLLTGFLIATASGVLFETIEDITLNASGIGTVEVMAMEMGAAGNVPAGTINIIVNPNPDILSVTNIEATKDGRDRETDVAFRDRLLQRRKNPETSGNKANYIRWAREVAGVGDAKVYRLVNGPQTVRVVIVDSEKRPASTALIAEVQKYIDPIPGMGEGQAPIGAVVTVVSALGKTINTFANVSLANGYHLQDVKVSFAARLEKWRASAAFVSPYVSQAVIGSLLLSTEGVLDYSNLKLNGGTGNVSLADDEVPLIGVVDLEV